MPDRIHPIPSALQELLAPKQASDLADQAGIQMQGEWLAQFLSPHSRRAYAADVRDFLRFRQITSAAQLQSVQMGEVLAWRLHLQQQGAGAATQRRKLSALASLFRYLCERQWITANPVQAVRRPVVQSYEGQTPALSGAEAKALLEAPSDTTLKGLRDRAILAMLLFQGLRRSELVALNRGDVHRDRGRWRLRVRGKGGRMRQLPLHKQALERIQAYLAHLPVAGPASPLFLALRNARGDGRLSAQSIYSQVVRRYGAELGLNDLPWFGPHVMRATAATQALAQGADLATVQHWLGHTSIQTTRAYDRRDRAPQVAALQLNYGD
ncbi:MAG: tyrosine-type recombinase/integrase [Lysobacterales bacterium]|nr:tyrosine-type recombinase/integrase [Xanthomonadales bacterium]